MQHMQVRTIPKALSSHRYASNLPVGKYYSWYSVGDLLSKKIVVAHVYYPVVFSMRENIDAEQLNSIVSHVWVL